MIKISEEEMIAEHKRLVKILKEGKRKQLNREAIRQGRELKTYIEKKDYCPRCAKRTHHIKHSGIKMCKICSWQEHY